MLDTFRASFSRVTGGVRRASHGGGAVNRIPLRAALAWIAAALLLFPFQRRLERSIGASGAVAGTESAAAEARIHSGFDSPFGEPALLVVNGLLGHAADSDSGRALMRVIAARLLSTGAVGRRPFARVVARHIACRLRAHHGPGDRRRQLCEAGCDGLAAR